jgi:predicted MFS family arabinose efflux permease
MQDANIGEVNLGLLGSLVFGGLIPGSLIASHIFQTYSAKRIMIVAGIGNILSLCLFPITANMLILSISRVLTGFFQVFFVIYFPVWVDIHAKNKRTRWLTYL